MAKPSLTEVRDRVRTRETWELLVLAGVQNVEFAGSTPRDAVLDFKAMQLEVVAELNRRGIEVTPNPEVFVVSSVG